ncbi:hypothetical protein [Deinococcus sp.]|uniref:hypothetical protein n=1 Tax=Deinococcus sp. TaxID=47478 RepID=UPI003C7EC6C1
MPDRSLPIPSPASPPQPTRRPYQAPRVQPLGQWSALTLVTTLPIGPGGLVFGGNTTA